MAPARGPTQRSSQIPLEALEGPGGTVLRQDSTLFGLPGGNGTILVEPSETWKS